MAPDGRHSGVGENCGRDDRKREATKRFGVGEVVQHQAGPGVGHMFQL